jgi:putative SOS response-associated peptidase YedK
MCAHYQIGSGLKDFLSLFAMEPDDVHTQEHSRPTDLVPAVLRQAENGQLKLARPRWGLVPAWLTPEDVGAKMMHARVETVAEKPAYREDFKSRRCILPMDSFFEFDKTSRYRISMEDHSPMGVAAIWEQNKSGLSCAMITTPTNELMSTIHERMPAILRPKDYLSWLDPSTGPNERLAMLTPRDIDGLKLERDGPRGRPVQEEDDSQLELLF